MEATCFWLITLVPVNHYTPAPFEGIGGCRIRRDELHPEAGGEKVRANPFSDADHVRKAMAVPSPKGASTKPGFWVAPARAGSVSARPN